MYIYIYIYIYGYQRESEREKEDTGLSSSLLSSLGTHIDSVARLEEARQRD